MRFREVFFAAFIVVASCAPASSLDAEYETVEFLHALQDQGYGDVAADYLQELRGRPDAPAGLRDVFDLEMYRSLRAAAKYAHNKEKHEKLLAEAENHLTRFIKEKPEHRESVAAMRYWGNFSTDRALRNLCAAQTAKEAEQKEKFLANARGALDEAKERLKQAAKMIKVRIDEMPAPTKGKPVAKRSAAALAQRESLVRESLAIRLQVCLADYYACHTYSDTGHPQRIAGLKAASKSLDAIFQEDRAGVIGFLARLWQGEVLYELRDVRAAEDVFNEVLRTPDLTAKDKDPLLADLFAQVEYFRAHVLKRQVPPD